MITKRYFELKEEENNLDIDWSEIDPPGDDMSNFEGVLWSILNGNIHDVRKSGLSVREFLVNEASESSRWNNTFEFFDDYNFRRFVSDVFQHSPGQLLVVMYSVNSTFVESENSRKMFENFDSRIPDEDVGRDGNATLY